MKRPLSLAAALMVLLAGARLSGQSYRSFREEFDAVRQMKLRFGAFRLAPVIRITDVGYDSNVYFAGEGSPIVADATATLSPEIRGYWLAGSSIILSATENPEFLAYAREMALRSFSNSFSASLRALALRRFSLSAEYHDLSHVRRSLSELGRRIRDTVSGATGSLFFETPRGTAVGVTGGVDDYRYLDVASGDPDDIYGRSLDRRETTAGLEVYYRIFSQSHLFSTVTWRSYDFRYPESAWRDASSIEASGGVRFPLAGSARGTVRLGWKSFRPDSPDEKPFAGLVAGTDVSLRLGRVALTLGLDRDNAFSYIESAYYYVDTAVRAGLSLYLLRSFRLDASVAYETMAYPEPQEIWAGGVPVVVERREDVQRTWSAGPVVRISGTVGLGLTYNLYRRTSNAPGFNIRRNFVGAFITYAF